MASSHMLILILGGLGLFLLGMAVMTDSLRALAGSSLRSVLARASATHTKGAFWGAAVTLIVQSSSATTMTTIGLVSAGILTFPQALSVIFGANIGTTGTGWLVALLGVKVSLYPAAMPLVFLGALLKLVGRGRWAAAGGSVAGFALLLIGLTVLQDGMSSLALQMNPADLPTITLDAGWWMLLPTMQLVLAGIVMTTLMQSSSAAVAATISALYAGAISPDQAAALVVGQNIGSAVSSAIAAIGASTPAKRTAVAHVLFNLITAIIVLAAFPFIIPFITNAAEHVDATILLAVFHTAYNILGVALLLPLVGPFARLVERLVGQRGPVLTRFLDRSTITLPAVAVDATQRTVASALRALCEEVARNAEQASRGNGRGSVDAVLVREARDALDQARLFLSGLSDLPPSDSERLRLADALHALDHGARFAANAQAGIERRLPITIWSEPQERAAADLCVRALRLAAGIASIVIETSAERQQPDPQSLDDLARCSADLAELRRSHRRASLSAAADHSPSQNVGAAVDRAIERVDHVRRLDRLAFHAWRASAHLFGAANLQPTSPPIAAQIIETDLNSQPPADPRAT